MESKFEIALFDECFPCAQALYHALICMGFRLQVLSHSSEELIRFLGMKPAILILHVDGRINYISLISHIRKKHSLLPILSHTTSEDMNYRNLLINSGSTFAMTGKYTLSDITDNIERLVPGLAIDVAIKNPVRKFDSDPPLIKVIQLMAKGKSTKEIANLIDMSESDVETRKRKIKQLTGSSNSVEAIAKLKDYQVI